MGVLAYDYAKVKEVEDLGDKTKLQVDKYLQNIETARFSRSPRCQDERFQSYRNLRSTKKTSSSSAKFLMEKHRFKTYRTTIKT